MEINDRIKFLIKFSDLNQNDLAKKMGTTPQYISSIIRGRDKVGLNFIKKLLDIFPEVNINWLLFGIGEQTVSNYEMKDSINLVGDSNEVSYDKSNINNEKLILENRHLKEINKILTERIADLQKIIDKLG